MRLLTHHRIRHLPVMDGDRLVVSIGDLVNAVISGHRPPVAHRHRRKYPAGERCGRVIRPVSPARVRPIDAGSREGLRQISGLGKKTGQICRNEKSSVSDLE